MLFSIVRIVFIITLLSLLLPAEKALCGTYLSSDHGNSTYGVDRKDSKLDGYAKGNCSHCHESHGIINGGEPDPAAGAPSPYTLFYTNHVDQDDNFCFQCHVDLLSKQESGGIINRSYSYRAGDWSADPVDDIQEAFSLTSSHSLDDILTFISTNPAAASWGYSPDSNPCSACHNPHAVQGDPPNSPNGVKAAASRGYPISRPSLHSGAWDVFGDEVGERMYDYSNSYQAPYRYSAGAATALEPVGDPLADSVPAAQNTTDFVTFCTDCHDSTNDIFSTSLGRNLYKFDWASEMHGGGVADDDSGNDFSPPYVDASAGIYELACSDCHEPHGSANEFLTRGEVNKSVVTIPSDRGKWKTLCQNCHGSTSDTHHLINPGDCTWNCHYFVWVDPPGVFNTEYRECTVCHFHGSTQIWNGTTNAYEVYNGGQRIF